MPENPLNLTKQIPLNLKEQKIIKNTMMLKKRL